jgi:type IX secretion system PorP/SprF family membrane protein
MKRRCIGNFFVLLFLLSFHFKGTAQVDPLFSQYTYNMLILNPAAAGSTSNISSALFWHNQWPGLEGNPNTQTLSIDGSIIHQSMGVGGFLMKDNIGNESNLSFSGCYAYKINFYRGILSMGLNGGVKRVRINSEDLSPKDMDDALVVSETYTFSMPDAGAGIMYKNKNFLMSASVNHLIPAVLKLSTESRSGSKVSRHYYLIMSYRFPVFPTWSLITSSMIRNVIHAPVNADFSVTFRKEEKVWAGLSYRTHGVLSWQAGIRLDELYIPINREIKLGISFDHVIKNKDLYKNPSFELFAVYNFVFKTRPEKIEKKIKSVSPRFF